MAIPKFSDFTYTNYWDIRYVCPCCDSVVSSHSSHCSACGEHLEWDKTTFLPEHYIQMLDSLSKLRYNEECTDFQYSLIRVILKDCYKMNHENFDKS